MKAKCEVREGRGFFCFMLAAALFIFMAPFLVTTADAGEGADPNEMCLGCHGAPGLSKKMADGAKLELYVDKEAFSASVHGGKLACTDCHSSITDFPHPERTYANRRVYTLTWYESCKRCHFENYTRTLESVHYQMLARGDLRAPVCVDCHGAHNIVHPQKRGLVISQSCARCHKGIYEAYLNSVHGKALVHENNSDVPTCIECHTAHSIEDARTASFRLRTPDLCGGCHGNEALMGKYGISSKVLKTYLQDFHGMTTALLRKGGQEGGPVTATCTDCHGIHDITRTDDPDSRVLKANLVKTCRRCHADANDRFPGAWLSHYEPSLKRAGLVFLVKKFYAFFIPFVIGGLIVHITLHLFRVASNR